MSTSFHKPVAQRGFTLVESLMAVTFLAVLFLAVAQTSKRASDAFDEGSVEHLLSTSMHRALERVAGEVEFGDGGVLVPPIELLGVSSVSFRVPADFAGGVVTWSDVIRLRLEREPGEADDGLDNDGDGLVDEGRVVRTVAPGTPAELSTVLVGGVAELLDGELANGVDDNGNLLVDEAGLSFSSEGDVVTIRLTCQRQDEAGRLLTKTGLTAVRLRNTGG